MTQVSQWLSDVCRNVNNCKQAHPEFPSKEGIPHTEPMFTLQIVSLLSFAAGYFLSLLSPNWESH